MWTKKISSYVLSLVMVLSLLSPIAVNAEEPAGTSTALEFDSANDYAIVDVNSGKAIDIGAPGWQTQTTVAGYYNDEDQSIESKSLMKITPAANQEGLAADEVKVTIDSVGLKDVYPLRSEAGNDFTFADAEKRTTENEYIISKTDDGQGIIKDTSRNYYFGIDSGKLKRYENISNAVEFKFIENPTVVDLTSLYIEHVATGKYVKANKVETADGTEYTLLVNGTADGDTIADDMRWTAVWGEFNGIQTAALVSKEAPQWGWQSHVWHGEINDGLPELILTKDKNGGWGGWESIQTVANGDGTISFKNQVNGKFFTVDADGKFVITSESEACDANGKFIFHIPLAPDAVTDVSVSKVRETELTVSWEGVSRNFYSGYKVTATPEVTSEKATIESDETNGTSIKLEGLEKDTQYDIQVWTVNGDGKKTGSEIKTVTTKSGPCPSSPEAIESTEAGDDIHLTWDSVSGANEGYFVYRAESAWGEYVKITENAVMDTEYTDETLSENGRYSNYYKVTAANGFGESDLSDAYTSLETELFGDHTIIFAPTDNMKTIDTILEKLFKQQHDFDADAQFKAGQYQVYFKPGDYTATSCINLGFYTSINGLGETPYDVKLNNIAIPAYLPVGELSNNADNATCNFWRSAENFSIIDTKTEKGYAKGLPDWRKEQFNWAVAQAAPLRRVFCERTAGYDWNYGWASGGYVADCKFTGADGAGTWSGQQFYTRNSDITNDAYGTTLNNFLQGCTAKNLPNSTTGDALINDNGYTNWNIASDDGGQQVCTSITATPRISEKPFLYLDEDGEYQVFVPALEEDTIGTSWAVDDMGAGESLPLSDFYIAQPEDTAEMINAQLDAGKSIYFTPGIYHAEEVIEVNNDNTILLGTGMTSIIPDNETAAIIVDDVDNVKLAGLIFDAGENSECLLMVGKDGANKDHSANPTVLQDLFFRVGGTVDTLTTADSALIINSNDVIGDHFWIWRADHGAGVSWDGNASQYGVIVNGDNVTCYALFNEHFEKYDTLWNGENGSTYFYQNEKCYDPISQEAWMSHNDTVEGYAAYKVANDVTEHYAVGLGMYNVFIYTGPTYDSSEVQIQLDSVMEVPNSPDVIIENACVQTFADDNKALQKFNHIINGVGGGCSSGIDAVTGEEGESWSRKFLISYQNGTAIVGKDTTYPTIDDRGKYLGVDVLTDVKAYGDNDLDATAIKAAVADAKELDYLDYSTASWAIFEPKFEEIEASLKDALKYSLKSDFEGADGIAADLLDELQTAKNGLVTMPRVTGVTLNKGTLALKVGENQTLTATVQPAGAGHKDITWSSDKPSIAKVENGKVTAVSAGTAVITVTTLDGSFKATCTVTVTVPDRPVVKVDISKVTIGKIAAQNYTGNKITPALKLTYNGKTLVKGTDYTVTYSSNTNLGNAQATIKGIGNYQGTKTASFAITVIKNKTYTVGSLKYKVTNAQTNGKGTVTVAGVKSKTLKTVDIKDTVKIGGKNFKITAIGDSTLKDCKKLTKVTIGKNVKTIGKKTFNNCSKLKTITIKSTVLNKVGSQALKGISKTAKIKVPSKKVAAYQTLFKNKGQVKTVKISK